MNRGVIIVFFALALIAFYKLLTFTFWKDDWLLLWASKYDVRSMHQYWSHPATLVEFMWLTKLFGTNPLPWQLVGIGLRTGAAIAVSSFASAIAKMPSVGLLSGIFFVVAVAGMDAVGWPSAHVVLWSTIFLLVGLTHLVHHIRGATREQYILSILFLAIGFFADPFRNFPIFFMIPILPLVIDISAKQRKEFMRILRIECISATAISIIVFMLFRKDILGSQLFLYLQREPNVIAMFKKIYVIGNFFNSITNLFFGWIVWFGEEASTGRYNRFAARIGFAIFCMSAGLAYEFYKKKTRFAGIMLFFVVWIFAFYVPNWLFEPRLTMGVTHRYMVLSSVGFALFAAHLVARVKRVAVQMLMISGFVLLNIAASWYYADIASHYRSAKFVQAMWQKIIWDVPTGAKNLLFVFEGEDPVKTYALGLSGSMPFVLQKNIAASSDIPIATGDRQLITSLLCGRGSTLIPLNHVYAWSVTNKGVVTNESLAVRRELLVATMAEGCVLKID